MLLKGRKGEDRDGMYGGGVRRECMLWDVVRMKEKNMNRIGRWDYGNGGKMYGMFE